MKYSHVVQNLETHLDNILILIYIHREEQDLTNSFNVRCEGKTWSDSIKQ